MRQMQLPFSQGVIVVGGQWGSEGKGAVIHEIAEDYDYHVRVGGPQAGHSIKLHPDGEPEILKLQTIPVGAASGKPAIIGMQSVVDLEVLEREIGWFRDLGLPLHLTIDARATVLDPAYREGESDMGLTEKLGSTGKGVGFARAERIMRRAKTVGEVSIPVNVTDDTDQMLASYLGQGHSVLIEAAQGIQLSLFSSGYYPYATSSEATPTGAFAETGLPLQYAPYFQSLGVFRTYPIRVAGNSGPLPGEITWEELEKRRGAPIDDSEKMTTVTRKVRRVAEWDAQTARESVVRCGLDAAVLTFLDYRFPEVTGETVWDNLPSLVQDYIDDRERDLGIPILAVGTSFGTYAWRR